MQEERRIEREEQKAEEQARRAANAAKRERMKSAQREPRGKVDEQKAPRAERVKTPAREPRQSRHQEETKTLAERKASKSVRRDDPLAMDNTMNLNEEPTGKQIFGLGGEMALASATSKRQKDKLKK